VEGTVEHSVLSPGVYVAPGAVVRNAVVMHDTMIQEDALVENAILDVDVVVGPAARVGKAHSHALALSTLLSKRLVVVEQGMCIPAPAVLEPDAILADWLLPAERADLCEARVSAAC
jgi:ADP-glucose pyrophosphorylase